MRLLLISILISVIAPTLNSCSHCTIGKSAKAHGGAPIAMPVTVENLGFARSKVFVDGNVTFAGQPSEEQLKKSLQEGVHKVINLRMEHEMKALGWEEEKLVEKLSGCYSLIPMSPSTFSLKQVHQFAKEFESTNEPVLVHCSTSNRCGAMWAAYLVVYKDYEVEKAIEFGKAAGLHSESMIAATHRVITEAKE